MNMKFLSFLFIVTLTSLTLSAQQEQQEKPKSPVEVAAAQADKLLTELKLNGKQLFQVDSVLQSNLTGVSNEFERMKKGGISTNEAYMNVRDSWQLKTEEAFKLILTEEQFIKYMKYIGKMDSKGRMKKLPRY